MTPVSLRLVDGVQVVVPDSLNLITPYVLREQQDWFEDEIRFLRTLLRPGQQVIDIGANYGVYTLSMAKAVGADGRVWAFEPASRTADFLARGIAANGFGQVVLERSALSSAPGSARLTLNDNAELNELVRGAGTTAGQTEEVPLTTLDECLDRFGWQAIDVVKMDAEGEEANILKGGQRFFTTLSPLVEYEVKAGHDLHLDLVAAFADLGYRSYRLVPGLQLLVPFDPATAPDSYLLNLFCCKPDRAALLAADGWLADTAPGVADPVPAPRHYWPEALAGRPFAKGLHEAWTRSGAGPGTAVADALALHAMSQDRELPVSERRHAMEASLRKLQAICSQDAGQLRLMSLARVAREAGARAVAVAALNRLAGQILQQQRVGATEVFLPPAPRYEAMTPGAGIGNWILGSVLEELERLGAFSSFYTGAATRQRLEAIVELGFASDEMKRRLRLLKQRFGIA